MYRCNNLGDHGSFSSFYLLKTSCDLIRWFDQCEGLLLTMWNDRWYLCHHLHSPRAWRRPRCSIWDCWHQFQPRVHLLHFYVDSSERCDVSAVDLSWIPPCSSVPSGQDRTLWISRGSQQSYLDSDRVRHSLYLVVMA